MILHYLNTNRLLKCPKGSEEEISRLIEMARLADYWLIDNKASEEAIAKKIKSVVLYYAVETMNLYVRENPLDVTSPFRERAFQTGGVLNAYRRQMQPNTRLLNNTHIDQVSDLRQGHAVQLLFVEAAVDDYLASYDDQRYVNMIHIAMPWMTEESLRIGREALNACMKADQKKKANEKIQMEKSGGWYFEDPFSGENVVVRQHTESFLQCWQQLVLDNKPAPRLQPKRHVPAWLRQIREDAKKVREDSKTT
jgi:hypothetical protein